MIVFSTIVLLPQYLQGLMGYTAMISGLALAPRIISSTIMIIIINPLMKVFDNRILISMGFLILGISVIMYMNINLLASFNYVSVPNILMGVGIILIFVPVSSLVLGTLPKSELSNGASLHNLCKSTTMAVVASIASTLVARHSQMHQVYLVKSLSDYNFIFQQKLISLISTFSASASSGFAHIKANAYMYKSLLTQSRLMAYVDVFEIFAIIAFCLIPLTILLNVNKQKEI